MEETKNKKEKLTDRINSIIEQSDNLAHDLYGDDADELTEQEIERISEGFKAFKKKINFVDKKNPFCLSPAAYLSKSIISKHVNPTKHGLYSVFPIPCKQDKCPYGDSCIALQNGIEPPYGEPCVLEVNKIENLIVGYSEDFKIDSSSTTDRILIQELIQLDIMMDRCQILLSQEGTPLQEVTMGITDDGEIYTQPVVSRYYEAWERMSKRRQSILNEMMATRHSRKGLKESPIDEKDALIEIINMAGFENVEERPEHLKDKEI